MQFSIVIGHHNKDMYRERNLKYVLWYYSNKCPDVDIIVVEQNSKTDLSMFPNVIHVKLTTEPGYNRGGNFNEGIKYCKHEMCLLVDNDCIINPLVIQNLDQYIKNYKVFIPYNICLDLNEEQTGTLINTNKITGGRKRGSYNICVGGSLFITKDAFDYIGGYETFKSHGGEDDCLYEKLKKTIGVSRIEGEFSMFHLWHPSSVNKVYLESDAYRHNCEILEKIRKMTKEELLVYIENKKYSHL